jgi:dTDP-4-dehydrorhamnose 3,5-epimerase-like enzyme
MAATIKNIRLIDLPKIADPRGNLTFVESERHIPFEIKRIYYLYGVPAGAERGGHAHKCLHQLMIAVSGSFDIVLDDGAQRDQVHLSRADQGLYISSMIWREMINFSAGAVCVVLASELYDESDYYRHYDEFLAAVRQSA